MSIAIKDSSQTEKKMEKAYKNSKAPLMMELLKMISRKAKVTWSFLSATNLKNNKKNKPRKLKNKTQEKTQKYLLISSQNLLISDKNLILKLKKL